MGEGMSLADYIMAEYYARRIEYLQSEIDVAQSSLAAYLEALESGGE